MSPSGRLPLLSHLAAAGVAVHVLESALPGFGPWFKPGLANIFTLVAFFYCGWGAAATVALTRVLLGALAMGTFLSPTFLLSLSGAMGAVVAMGIVRHSPVALGPVGVSLLAALAHMAGQFGAAYGLLFQQTGLFLLLPWFLAGAWLTGVANGLIAIRILQRMACLARERPLPS